MSRSDSRRTFSALDDHALEPVPHGDRRGWLAISWSTVGIGTTLIQLYIGAMICFVAGVRIGLAAGIFVAALGSLIGWGTGHMAYRTGLTSTLMARRHGFGVRGSLITSSIFGFMLIGFIAVENVLLYKGFLFYFGLGDSITARVAGYGLLTLAWIVLTTWGFTLVTRVSSLMLVAFVLVLLYMLVVIGQASNVSFAAAIGFGTQVSAETLVTLGATTPLAKFVFCVNILAGSAGALALIDADLGRYARTSRDIGIAALLGNLSLDVVMVVLGGTVMFAGMPLLVDYYVGVESMSPAEAAHVATANPDRIAAAFIIFGGSLGAILMFAAQSKAQVLNTYSSSLSMANLMDALLGWRPGRFVFVVAVNALSLVFLYGNILAWFNSFLVVLGILTTCFAAIMLADYFIVRPRLPLADPGSEAINWAGVASLASGFVAAHYLLGQWNPIEFLSAITVSAVVYPCLRLGVLRPRDVA